MCVCLFVVSCRVCALSGCMCMHLMRGGGGGVFSSFF